MIVHCRKHGYFVYRLRSAFAFIYLLVAHHQDDEARKGGRIYLGIAQHVNRTFASRRYGRGN